MRSGLDFPREERHLREGSIMTKAKVFQAVVGSILLYGRETWPVRAEDLHKLEGFGNDCLRIIHRQRRVDRVPAIELCKKLNLLSIPRSWFNVTSVGLGMRQDVRVVKSSAMFCS